MQPEISQIVQNHQLFVERIISSDLQSNAYLVACNESREAAIIDPGLPADLLKSRLKKHNFNLKFVINTHGHIDHIQFNDELDAPVYIHEKDSSYLSQPELNLSGFIMGQSMILDKADKLLAEGDIISVGKLNLKVMHTPGHTPGSICLQGNNLVFTGDTLFFNGIGRCDFPGSSEVQLLESVKKKLFKLPDETLVLAGHGPETTIGRERKFNPFLKF
jgi:hydroxyacylglutathione hydrolase